MCIDCNRLNEGIWLAILPRPGQPLSASMCYAIPHECSNPGANSYRCKKCALKLSELHVPVTLMHASYEFKDCFQKVSKAGLNPLLWYGTLYVAKQAWDDLPAEFNAAWRHRAQRTKEIGIRGKSLKVWLQLLLTACSINRCRALKTKGLPRILFISSTSLNFALWTSKKSLWGLT